MIEATLPDELKRRAGRRPRPGRAARPAHRELHDALAQGDSPRLRPQVFNAHAQRSFYQAMRTEAKATAAALRSLPRRRWLSCLPAD